MENIILTKLKEFIKSKVKLEKRLTDEFVSGKRELIGQIDFLRELILEFIKMTKQELKTILEAHEKWLKV